jgi:hypothetical protein
MLNIVNPCFQELVLHSLMMILATTYNVYWVTPTKSSKVKDNDTYKILGKGRCRINITQTAQHRLSHNGNVGSNSTIVNSNHIRQ